MNQARISDYAKGWNDAALGRPPRSTTIGYRLGYIDASKSLI
ncbi:MULTISPECIES: hypothetical protein [Burkholderia]|nr:MULTISPECIES: hypothetical protein [Burkholderia]